MFFAERRRFYIAFSSVFNPFFFKSLFNYFWNWLDFFKSCKLMIHFVQIFISANETVNLFIDIKAVR